MEHSGSIKIHSREEAEKLLEMYAPLLKKAEERYRHLKSTVETLESLLNDNESRPSISKTEAKTPIKWNPNSWADRALLALGIIGEECLSRNLVKIILENEPNIKKQTAEKSLSSALWSLEKDGKIIRRNDDNNRKLISLPEWK